MTANPQMHPLRCETCGWFQLHHINECDIFGAMSPAMLELIKKVGCASHSASSDVLEELNTFDIITVLKKRYWNEEAVLDSLENVEDEVLAAQRGAEGAVSV